MLREMGLTLDGVTDGSGRGFVVDTWLRSYRRIFRCEGLDAARWYAGQRQVIEALLPQTYVATRPSAPHTVHAWVCGSPGLLHYVYVASELRRRGLGRALIVAASGEHGAVTHKPPADARGAFRGFIWDPFALYEALRKAA